MGGGGGSFTIKSENHSGVRNYSFHLRFLQKTTRVLLTVILKYHAPALFEGEGGGPALEVRLQSRAAF